MRDESNRSSTEGKLLTIIVPSFNMERYLPKALDSLLVRRDRLPDDLEVIVVNDGSTDRTSEVAHDYEKRFPGIVRVIDKTNGNYGSCINAALPAASGWFVKIVDADDCVDSEAFSRFLDALSEERDLGDRSADLVLADYVHVDSTGQVVKRVAFPLREGRNLVLPDCSRSFVQFGIHAVTYRLDAVKSVGYRQTEGISYTDLEWIVEPMAAVRRVSYYPLPVSRYLVGRPGQTTENAETIARHFSHFVAIADHFVANHSRLSGLCVPDAAPYYRGMVLQHLSRIYEADLFGFRGHRVSVDVRSLDSAIRNDPTLFQATEHARIWSRRFPIRLIWCWRRHPGLGTLPLLAYGLFLKLKSFGK